MRDRARDQLRAAGISFQEANHGAMFIVADAWIFWPGVWRWRGRYDKAIEGTGVKTLISRIRRDQEKANG